MEDERQAHAGFLQSTVHTRNAGPRSPPRTWQLCIGYLKVKLEKGYVFTLPQALFTDALVVLDEAALLNADPVAPILEAASPEVV